MADKIIVTVDIDLEDLIPGFLENRKKDKKMVHPTDVRYLVLT